MTSVLRYSRPPGLVPQRIHGVKWLVPVVFKSVNHSLMLESQKTPSSLVALEEAAYGQVIKGDTGVFGGARRVVKRVCRRALSRSGNKAGGACGWCSDRIPAVI